MNAAISLADSQESSIVPRLTDVGRDGPDTYNYDHSWKSRAGTTQKLFEVALMHIHLGT